MEIRLSPPASREWKHSEVRKAFRCATLTFMFGGCCNVALSVQVSRSDNSVTLQEHHLLNNDRTSHNQAKQGQKQCEMPFVSVEVLRLRV